MLNLDTLNSATKYPSIPTYHGLGERGALTEEVTQFTGEAILTEKVDGTSSRIILTPDGDWFIGSREELLTACGDRVHNPALGIVEALRALAHRIRGMESGHLAVYYLETYGARIGSNAKQYTGSGAVGYRMFDLAYVPLHVLDWDREKIASWRDHGGQSFAREDRLQQIAIGDEIDLVPRLATIPAEALPASIELTHAWLAETLPKTLVGLDDSAGGRPEGIVLRTADRAVITKARFEDYERTIRRRAKNR